MEHLTNVLIDILANIIVYTFFFVKLVWGMLWTLGGELGHLGAALFVWWVLYQLWTLTPWGAKQEAIYKQEREELNKTRIANEQMIDKMVKDGIIST